MSSYNHFGCSWCGGPFNGGNCPGCSSIGSVNEFVNEPNPYSYNETPNFFNQPPQHQYETYSCELCGDRSHYGFDCQIRTPLINEQDPCNNQIFSNDQSYSLSQPQQFDYCERSDEGDNEINSLIIKPSDTFLMGDEVISTIPERENDKFIKPSVDDLVPILRESEVTSICDDLECDMPITTPTPPTDTSELILAELTTKIGLDDSIPTKIDDGYYDSEGNILFLEHLLIEETFIDPTPAVLPKESTLLVTPLPDPKQIWLREVENFDPFFSLT
nr:hypothetical protein [Tanacetum cinerariifolium]